MSRRRRLIFLLSALVVLLVVARVTTGDFDFLLGDFWFSAGLLLLILLSVVDQPHFSRDANVFMNGVAGLISLIAVSGVERTMLWHLFFIWSIYLVATSYLLMIARSRPLTAEGSSIQLLSRVNRQIGRPEALFSAFFLWGVMQQFPADSGAYKALLIFWALFIVLNLPAVAAAIEKALDSRGEKPDTIEGVVTKFVSPRLFECRLNASGKRLEPGAEVCVLAPGGKIAAQATVIEDRILHRSRVAVLAVTTKASAWQLLADESPGAETQISIQTNAALKGVPRPVGMVSSGSNIGLLKVRVHPDIDLSEGEIISVPFSSNVVAITR